MSRRSVCFAFAALAVASWATGLVTLIAALPMPRGWLLFVFAAGIVGSIGALLAHLQRPLDDVARFFYEAGRRDMLREMNRPRPAEPTPLRRRDA